MAIELAKPSLGRPGGRSPLIAALRSGAFQRASVWINGQAIAKRRVASVARGPGARGRYFGRRLGAGVGGTICARGRRDVTRACRAA